MLSQWWWRYIVYTPSNLIIYIDEAMPPPPLQQMPNILFIGRHFLVFITSCISLLQIDKINLLQILLTMKVNTHYYYYHHHKISMTISERGEIKIATEADGRWGILATESVIRIWNNWQCYASMMYWEIFTIQLDIIWLSFYTAQSKQSIDFIAHCFAFHTLHIQ